ncbi:MAG: carboxyl-terminal processing protease, partial [Alcanivorax sp.]
DVDVDADDNAVDEEFVDEKDADLPSGADNAESVAAAETRAEDESANEADEADEPDLLLTEAGNVLVDALMIKRQAFAVNTPPETD